MRYRAAASSPGHHAPRKSRIDDDRSRTAATPSPRPGVVVGERRPTRGAERCADVRRDRPGHPWRGRELGVGRHDVRERRGRRRDDDGGYGARVRRRRNGAARSRHTGRRPQRGARYDRQLGDRVCTTPGRPIPRVRHYLQHARAAHRPGYAGRRAELRIRDRRDRPFWHGGRDGGYRTSRDPPAVHLFDGDRHDVRDSGVARRPERRRHRDRLRRDRRVHRPARRDRPPRLSLRQRSYPGSRLVRRQQRSARDRRGWRGRRRGLARRRHAACLQVPERGPAGSRHPGRRLERGARHRRRRRHRWMGRRRPRTAARLPLAQRGDDRPEHAHRRRRVGPRGGDGAGRHRRPRRGDGPEPDCRLWASRRRGARLPPRTID